MDTTDDTMQNASPQDTVAEETQKDTILTDNEASRAEAEYNDLFFTVEQKEGRERKDNYENNKKLQIHILNIRIETIQYVAKLKKWLIIVFTSFLSISFILAVIVLMFSLFFPLLFSPEVKTYLVPFVTFGFGLIVDKVMDLIFPKTS